MDHPASEQVLRFRTVGFHVGGYGVRAERIHALPLLDHDEGIWAVLGLHGECGVGVDRGAVLDASLFGADRGDVGTEVLQDFLALAGLCSDDRDDVDYLVPPRIGVRPSQEESGSDPSQPCQTA